MCATRVVNPFSLTEMRRLREAVVARPMAFRPDPEARARVARNLWGCASSSESRAFVTRELESQRERAAERWGFDFLREVPRAGASRYQWKPVKIGTVPRAYKMPRMTPPRVNVDAVLETARATVPVVPVRKQEPQTTTTAEMSVPLAMASPDLASPPSSTTTSSASSAQPSPATRQTTLKDFLVCRKRPLAAVKHEETTSSNSKRARTSL